MNKENCEEHPRSNLAQNSNSPRSQEDYITQVSQRIEGRVTKRLSKEFSRTENRILGALARLDDFLMNPLLQGRSGATPEASRNPLSTSQRTNEDNSQNDPHPEAGLFHNQITQNSGPEEDHDIQSFYYIICSLLGEIFQDAAVHSDLISFLPRIISTEIYSNAAKNLLTPPLFAAE